MSASEASLFLFYTQLSAYLFVGIRFDTPLPLLTPPPCSSSSSSMAMLLSPSSSPSNVVVAKLVTRSVVQIVLPSLFPTLLEP